MKLGYPLSYMQLRVRPIGANNGYGERGWFVNHKPVVEKLVNELLGRFYSKVA
jgi:hypothetical protein